MFIFNAIVLIFIQIPDMIAPAVWAGNVNINSQGWFIFGGQGNNLNQAQQYVNEEWQLGPDLIGSKPTGVQCVTKVINVSRCNIRENYYM
jgi:hypothetical protein